MPRTGFIIFCPHGHQIEVQDRHRGMMGRCPKCKAFYLVPKAEWDKPKAAPEEPAKTETPESAETSAVAQKYRRWMTDLHFHSVDPAKLKLKPGSVADNYEFADLGFAKDGLLLAKLLKGGGLFGSADKKRPEARAAMLAYLEQDKPLDELPAVDHQWFDAEGMQIQVVQPAPYAHESLFAGVPVFGSGRVAVRVPQADESGQLQFLSFGLSDFREFARDLAELFGLHDLGADCGVPLTDTITELTCHYSEQTLRVVENVEYYQADPRISVNLVGWRCQGCRLVISEDSRKKERIGGTSGKGIAKARCPKCKAKFGEERLYALDSGPQSPDVDASDDDAASDD